MEEKVALGVSGDVGVLVEELQEIAKSSNAFEIGVSLDREISGDDASGKREESLPSEALA